MAGETKSSDLQQDDDSANSLEHGETISSCQWIRLASKRIQFIHFLATDTFAAGKNFSLKIEALFFKTIDQITSREKTRQKVFSEKDHI